MSTEPPDAFKAFIHTRQNVLCVKPRDRYGYDDIEKIASIAVAECGAWEKAWDRLYAWFSPEMESIANYVAYVGFREKMDELDPRKVNT
ncbi:MAG: hypothetical protein GY906_38950 [bacterium]|nr:hypothetical protein [bacterium]